jgi:hypothetical protein
MILLAMVAYNYNPSFLGGKKRRLLFKASQGKSICETLFKNKSGWWFNPVIPAIHRYEEV